MGTNVVQHPTEMKVVVYENTYSAHDVIHATYAIDDIDDIDSYTSAIGGANSNTDWGLCPVNHYCRHPQVASFMPTLAPRFDPSPALAIGPSPKNPNLQEAACVAWVQPVDQINRIYVHCHDL